MQFLKKNKDILLLISILIVCIVGITQLFTYKSEAIRSGQVPEADHVMPGDEILKRISLLIVDKNSDGSFTIWTNNIGDATELKRAYCTYDPQVIKAINDNYLVSTDMMKSEALILYSIPKATDPEKNCRQFNGVYMYKIISINFLPNQLSISTPELTITPK